MHYLCMSRWFTRGPVMLHKLKIAPRLAILIILGVGTVTGIATYFDYVMGRKMFSEELHGRVENLAAATAGEMEVVKRAVEKVVQEVAVVLEDNKLSTEQSYRLLERTLERHHELYGAAIALDTPALDGKNEPIVPYVHRTLEGNKRVNLHVDGYHIKEADWYFLPYQLRKPAWTEPYFDEGGGNIIMVTYSVPLRDSKTGKFIGVVTGDVSLEWLRTLVEGMDLGEGGKAFIISRSGTFVTYPDKNDIMTQTIFSLAEEKGWTGIRALGQKMIRGEKGFEPVDLTNDDGDEFWIAYTPVLDMGWSLGAFFPQRQVMARLYELGKVRLIMCLAGGLGLIIVVWRIARSITRPLTDLETAAEGLASGNLNTPIPVLPGKDEVATLSRSFSKMQGDLKSYISRLEDEASQRAKIETDLKVAHDIQASLVPRNFDLTTYSHRVSVAADLQPAREVGGDFFDFFFLDSDRFFFAVGDASGKGIPASLFVAVTQAYLRAFIRSDDDPGRALARVNDALADSNDTNMFISLFCAILNVKTGELVFANAGHNPTYLLGPGLVSKSLVMGKGGLLGIFPGQTFETGRTRLQPGQTLLGYSDGIVEAENAAQEFYTEEKMAEFIATCAGDTPEQIVSKLKADVATFVAGADQSDDMTIIAVNLK